MYSGVAGLKAFKSDLDVIGNNIANVNTVAYKAGRVTFKDALSQTMAGASGPVGSRGGSNPIQVGLGVVVGSVDENITDGSPQSTGRQTDLAINGNGYFAVGDGAKTVYTRDGSFVLDAQNNLVSGSSGMKVLGWTADPNTGILDVSAPVTPKSGINIPIGSLTTARQTSTAELVGNLNAIADPANPSDVWNAESQIYDSLGVLHKLSINFQKTANVNGNAAWNYTITSPDGAVTGGTGTITFDSNGYSQLASIPISLALTSPNGSVQPIALTLKTGQISQMNGDSNVNQSFQDGLPLGTLESYTIGQDGIISGTFTNGSNRSLGQIAIAQFTNPAGLMKIGNNMVTESPNSGSAQIGVPGGGSRGLISSGFLEASNVDLAGEFANMIIAQRGFQANSKVITTSDEVLQDLVGLKR